MDITNPYPRLSDVQENNQEIEGSFVRFKPMVTPQNVIDFGLMGVPKTFPMTGEPMTVEYIANHLEAAIAEIEMTGLMLSPVIFHHLDDYQEGNSLYGQRFFPILLKKYPVRNIESIELTFPNATTDKPSLIYRIPDDWITWDQTKVNVVATTGVINPTIQQGSASLPYINLFHANYRPTAFRVNFRAGFDQDKLPVIVWRLIIDKATYSILSEIGPLLFPSTGISVGIDAVSQSAQLPGYRIFEARLKDLASRIEKNRQLIAGYYGNQMTIEFAGI